MSLAINANGTLFQRSTDGGTTFNTIPEVARVNAPDVKTDLQDVTTHDSPGGFREYLPGLKDGDQVSAEMFFVFANTIHVGIRTDAYAATKRFYREVFPGGSGPDEDTVKYEAYVTGFPPQADIGNPLRVTGSFKVTGMPVWAAT